MLIPVWIFVAYLVVHFAIGVVLQLWFHATGAAVVVEATGVVLALLLIHRLKEARVSTPEVVKIFVPLSRMWSMTSVLVIGVIVAIIILLFKR